MSPLAHVLKGLVLTYRYSLSSLIGNECRFRPTCSEYAMDAITAHGALKGGWLAARRMARCNPWGGSGWDPVIPAESTPDETDITGRPASGHR
jgi:putative membrane protein insertion efficiency factor